MVLFCCGGTYLSEISRIEKWESDSHHIVKKKITGPICYEPFLFLWVKQRKLQETKSNRKFTQMLWTLTRGTTRFSNSFISINWTSVKCSLGKHTAFPSIRALLFCLRRKTGRYANMDATSINFLICKKNAWVTKLEKKEVAFLVTKRTIYSSQADSWMLREVKILLQSEVQVITVPE